MKNNAADVMKTFREIGEESMGACQAQYEDICYRENVEPVGKIKILDYSELMDHAVEKIGKEAVEEVNIVLLAIQHSMNGKCQYKFVMNCCHYVRSKLRLLCSFSHLLIIQRLIHLKIHWYKQKLQKLSNYYETNSRQKQSKFIILMGFLI